MSVLLLCGALLGAPSGVSEGVPPDPDLRASSATAVVINERVRYTEEVVPTAAGPATVGSLRIADYRQAYQLAVALPAGGMGTLDPLEEMIRAQGGAFGINANFYDPDTNLPIGLLIRNGQLEHEDYARRGAVGVDLFGGLHFARLQARAFLFLEAADRRLPLDGLNRPVKEDELVAITPAYGLTLRLPEAAQVLLLKGDRVQALERRRVIAPDPDRGQTYLIATGRAASALSELRLRPGARVRLGYALDPPLPWPLRTAVGAGPLLIQDGRIVLDPLIEGFDPAFATARAARSALGLTPTGDLLLVVVLGGETSAGMTLEELAQVMRRMGASQALALDGGGSASLAFRQGRHVRVVGSTRPIAVGLLLVPR